MFGNTSFANTSPGKEDIQKEEEASRGGDKLLLFNKRNSPYLLTSTGSGLACNGRIQFSLGLDGFNVVEPGHILEPDTITPANYQVELLSGSRIGTDTVDCSYLNQVTSVKITQISNGNSCWGEIVVEDKMPPRITCDTIAAFCNMILHPDSLCSYPTGVDNCSDSTLTYTYADAPPTVFSSCGGNSNDPDTIQAISRTWVGRDASGNSDTCVQMIYVLKPTLASVIFPDSLQDTTALSCHEYNTDKSVTGVPYVRIKPPNKDSVDIPIDQFCKFGVYTNDQTITVGCAGKKRIYREWTVIDWCMIGNGVATVLHTQVIDITDTIPPLYDTIRVSEFSVLNNNSHKCMVDIKPAIPVGMRDVCNSGVNFTILGPTKTIYNDSTDFFPNVPLGSHDFVYIIADSCGNEVRDTVTYEVKDETIPLAIAQEIVINLVDTLGNTWVYATSLDGGSSDNCSSLDSILFKKESQDTFATALSFNCEDVGRVRLTLRVVDQSGNAAEVDKVIIVSDKSGNCDNDGDGIPDSVEDANGNGIVDPGESDPRNHCDPNGATANAGTDQTICNGASIGLNASGGATYQWSPSIGLNNTTIPNPIASPTTTTTYTVKVTDTRSCTDSAQVIITVATPAQVNAGADQTICEGDSVQLSATGAVTYEWSPTTGLNNQNIANPKASPKSTTTYTVTGTDVNGCTSTDAVLITIDTCPDPIGEAFVSIAGHIENENGEMVDDVTISIDGHEMTPTTTGIDGTYKFDQVPMDGSYMVEPNKNLNYANGISTYDIVLLSKHILGLKSIDSPYKLIAADVNNTRSITAFDMVLMRQMILGIRNDFPNNTSWRFVDATYEFKNPSDPFSEDFPEHYEIKNLKSDMMTLDFIAIKVGDLNANAIANRQLVTGGRSHTPSKSLKLQITEQLKKAGEKVVVDFKAGNFKEILGYQFSLDFDGNALNFEQLLIGKYAAFENFNLSNIHRGIITTSWSNAKPQTLDADEVLFSLVFTSKQDVTLSEHIQLSSSITSAEAYSSEEAALNVELAIENPIKEQADFTLYQNKPNPFTGETTIGFDLPKESTATLTIFDMSGTIIKEISNQYQKGYNQVILNGKDFTEHGMYYYQLATKKGIETKKMIILR